MMYDLYCRVADWNKKRYDQVYSHKLTCDLFLEEWNEWREATTPVEELDALCDIVYVGIGALWKRKVNLQDVEDYAGTLMRDEHNEYFKSNTPFLTLGREIGLLKNIPSEMTGRILNIIYAAMAQMMHMGLTHIDINDAMIAVCDSNDTKKVEKVKSTIKANKDKGDDFVSPEAKLAEILDRRVKR